MRRYCDDECKRAEVRKARKIKRAAVKRAKVQHAKYMRRKARAAMVAAMPTPPKVKASPQPKGAEDMGTIDLGRAAEILARMRQRLG